jgi:hypothetical protein
VTAPRKLGVGDRVTHVDATHVHVGTIVKFVGRRGVGGGVHAKVQWDDAGTSVVRPIFLRSTDE